MISKEQPLQQLLDELPQTKPSAALDDRIMEAVENLLKLESYLKAEQLLSSQYARLDDRTKSNLHTAMSAIKQQYGDGFEAAYSDFVKQQNAMQTYSRLNEPEHGRG